MIQITLTFSTLTDAVAALHSIAAPAVTVEPGLGAAALGHTGDAFAFDTPSNAEPAAKPARAPKGKKAEVAAPATPAPQIATESTAVTTHVPAEEEPAALNYESDVKPLLVGALQSAGMSKVQAVLKQFGAAKGSDVAAGKLAEFRAAIEALTDAPQEAGLL